MKTQAFETLKNESRKYGETNDCGVIALAACCRVDYSTAHGALRREGRKFGKGTYMSAFHRAANALGYKTDDGQFRNFAGGTRLSSIVRRKGSGLTVSTAPKWLPRRGVFVLVTARHVLTMVNGNVIDWSAGRKHRITNIYEVTKYDFRT